MTISQDNLRNLLLEQIRHLGVTLDVPASHFGYQEYEDLRTEYWCALEVVLGRLVTLSIALHGRIV